MGYSLYVSAVVLIQIVSVYILLKKIDTNPGVVNKMSLTTIAMCNIEDFYLTMIHIEFIMTSGVKLCLFSRVLISYTLYLHYVT